MGNVNAWKYARVVDNSPDIHTADMHVGGLALEL